MAASAFLDEADLVRLTGYVRPSKQKEWLDAHGIPCTVNARGEVIVRRDLDQPESTFELGPVR